MTTPVAASSATLCPECGAVVPPEAVFCEACGHQLRVAPAGSTDGRPVVGGAEVPITLSTRTLMTEPATGAAPEPVCPECGGHYADDGYCENCGAKRPDPRDHFTEQPATWVAGACDRGIRHTTNEDAMATSADAEPGSRAVLVVCDGVSNTVHSDVASLAAARAARDLLASRRGLGVGTPQSAAAATADALRQAAEASRAEVVRLSPGSIENPPSCTFVAVVLDGQRVVTANIGDSRAYWLPDRGEARTLTTDDSVAAEQIAGGMSQQEAESGPHSHAITRWLGVDAPVGPPRVTVADLDGPGWVLLCSDGLWNYCSSAADLVDLVRSEADNAGHDPLALAEALVAFANSRGGQDNITVVLARVAARFGPEG